MNQKMHTEHHYIKRSIEILCGVIVMVLCWFATTNSAGACALDKVPFGIGATTLKQNYNIDASELSGIGEDIIHTRGNRLCKDLKPHVRLELTLVDDQLIRIIFEDSNAENALLPIAEEVFGAAWNQPNPSKPGVPYMHNAWDDETSDRVAIYSYHEARGRPIQLLEIASKNHKILFEKLAKQGENIGGAP